jgi:[acyl-carrier-protein] S-malonyltransferase
MKSAYVFPGQGAQYVGMGRDVYDAYPLVRDVFDNADRTVGFPLSSLCFEGPESDLTLTVNVQPALVTVCLALLAVISSKPSFIGPDYVAGHSLGEYTALAAAGVFDTATAIHLARERGRLMHAASAQNPGAMLAVLGADESQVNDLCHACDVEMANFNSPGQIVISGTRSGIDRAREAAKEYGASRAVPLAVSGAFHSRLMQPAVEGMTVALENVTMNTPRVPVIANTTGEPLTDVPSVKAELLRQFCNCVRWQPTIEYLDGVGVSNFIEIGPGKVITGLIKRIKREANLSNISNLDSLNAYLGV